MRVTTTISPGPRSTDLERLEKEIESHPIWTELRGAGHHRFVEGRHPPTSDTVWLARRRCCPSNRPCPASSMRITTLW
jgi:hypothetical protein